MKNERKKQIKEMMENGITYREIGKKLKISHQRVHQIYTGYKSPANNPFYTSKMRFLKKEEREIIFKQKIKEREEKENELEEKIKKGEIADLSGLGKKFSGRDLVREGVRRRDGYKCQMCFKEWKEGNRRFDIHHLNGLCGKKSRGYDRVDEIKGLITLCHKCHLGLDSVRKKMGKTGC